MSKKVIAHTFLTLSLLASLTSAHAFDTSLKGFIALDLANFEKIEGKKGSTVVGIGVLDLKVFAEQEGLTFNMKLDLDGKLAEENNIFEEAYVGYRGIRDWRFMAGKGVVRFQNIHWGVAENSYQDGGSVLGSENSFRKLSRRAFLAASYGHYSRGFLNTFSFFGNSSEIKTDSDGDAEITTKYFDDKTNNIYTYTKSYTYEPVTAFDVDKQIGLANKFEYYVNQELTLTQGLVMMRNKFTGKTTWGAAASLRYETGAYELWSEAIHGYTTTSPYEKYATYKKKESYLQLGGEYFLNHEWSLLANTEGLVVEDKAHTYPSVTNNNKTYIYSQKNAAQIDTVQYKFESGVKYKISKSAQITLSALWERKLVEQNNVENLKRINGVYDPNRQAFKVASAVSYWF